MTIKIQKQAFTHGGKFHADDVFSAALLRIINPDVKIIRGFEVPANFDGIVFDIGRGRFDHHQENSEVRPNGVPYAAFGLLWREFGTSVLSEGCNQEEAAVEAEHFDEKFIQPIDSDDNTGCGNSLSDAIGAFNPAWDSERTPDQCFCEALDFAAAVLKKEIERFFSARRAKDLVEKALSDSTGGIVILPRFAPWKAVLIPSDALFVVYPSQRGGYSAQVVPADFDSEEAKRSFPEQWAGKPEGELKRITGLKTIRFCHKGRFILSADKLEDAVRACKMASRES